MRIMRKKIAGTCGESLLHPHHPLFILSLFSSLIAHTTHREADTLIVAEEPHIGAVMVELEVPRVEAAALRSTPKAGVVA